MEKVLTYSLLAFLGCITWVNGALIVERETEGSQGRNSFEYDCIQSDYCENLCTNNYVSSTSIYKYQCNGGPNLQCFAEATNQKCKADSSNNSTTFAISCIEPSLVQGYNDPDSVIGEHVIMELKEYKNAQLSSVIQGTEFPSQGIRSKHNGFVHTILEAYGQHHNLVLRPDDIWLGIATQFSLYVNANAEKFRGQFVNHTGKIKLTARTAGTLESVSYADLIDQMTDLIDEKLIDPEIKNWIIPDFTTSRDDDKVVGGVMLMATMKKYFDYDFAIMCGIPKITILGTIEDWNKIKIRIQKLRSYDLDSWVEKLELIVDQFIAVKNNNIDTTFWQQMVHSEVEGCGSRFITGWITVFCAFDKKGSWQMVESPSHNQPGWPRLDLEDVPPGIVQVDVKINDNGKEIDSILFAGHMAAEMVDGGYGLQPRVGWAIAIK